MSDGYDINVSEYLTEWSIERYLGWRQRYATFTMVPGMPGRPVGKAHYLRENGSALCGKQLNRSFLSVLCGDHCQSCEASLARDESE